MSFFAAADSAVTRVYGEYASFPGNGSSRETYTERRYPAAVSGRMEIQVVDASIAGTFSLHIILEDIQIQPGVVSAARRDDEVSFPTEGAARD